MRGKRRKSSESIEEHERQSETRELSIFSGIETYLVRSKGWGTPEWNDREEEGGGAAFGGRRLLITEGCGHAGYTSLTAGPHRVHTSCLDRFEAHAEPDATRAAASAAAC